MFSCRLFIRLLLEVVRKHDGGHPALPQRDPNRPVHEVAHLRRCGGLFDERPGDVFKQARQVNFLLIMAADGISWLLTGVEDSAQLYAFGAVATKVNVVHADRNTPGFMRSPPVVPYIYALESAMDEMALKLEMDPVEFRRINDTMASPLARRQQSPMRCD